MAPIKSKKHSQRCPTHVCNEHTPRDLQLQTSNIREHCELHDNQDHWHFTCNCYQHNDNFRMNLDTGISTQDRMTTPGETGQFLSKVADHSTDAIPDLHLTKRDQEIFRLYLNAHKRPDEDDALENKQLILKPKDRNRLQVLRNNSDVHSTFLQQVIVMMLWFLFSFLTIFLNKYILSPLSGDPGILGECQLLITTVLGLVTMYLPCAESKVDRVNKNSQAERFTFIKAVSILGWIRFGAVVCSVVALKHVAVSFSETVKSSAPIFTVITAYIVLGEYSGIYVNLSLLPITFGLAICFVGELSFTATGFIAAICNNVLDCIQNVYSKKLLSGETKYNPLELQFYTCLAATIVQMPFWILFMNARERLEEVDRLMVMMLAINGVSFYFQSVTAYLLMSLISPVTFSVASTAKRALSIWFSVILFGNPVTVTSALGTVLVVIGVALYQAARHKEATLRMKRQLDADIKKSPA